MLKKIDCFYWMYYVIKKIKMVIEMKKSLKYSNKSASFVLFFAMFYLFLFLLSCSPVRSLNVDEISTLINSGNENLIIIDLREVTEYSKGHIKGAINIPFNEDTFSERISDLAEKDSNALFYCGRGVKTGKAEKFIKKSSFSKKYILDGGFWAWKEKGLEIEK